MTYLQSDPVLFSTFMADLKQKGFQEEYTAFIKECMDKEAKINW